MKYSLGISFSWRESLVFPILLFSSISLHWSLRKAFLSLLAILWNSAFRWVYLSFAPLPFTSVLFTAICKASSDSHFAFLFLHLPLSWWTFRLFASFIPFVCVSHCQQFSPSPAPAQQYFISVCQSDSENVTGFTYFLKNCFVLAVLHLHCCVQAFLELWSAGSSWVVCRRLTALASLVDRGLL